MKKIVSTSLFTACLFTGLSTFAQPPTNHASLIGEWENTNPLTHGIVKVIIRNYGTSITVQPFAACSPAPCEYGMIRARAYSEGDASDASIGFSAARDHGVKTTVYNGFLQTQEQTLTLLTQNKFNKTDAQYNNTVMETFKKLIVPANK